MTQPINTKDLRVTRGDHFNLKDFPTKLRKDLPKKVLQDMVQKDSATISELQERLYARKEQALLIIIQAMDAAGKDSVIKHVLSGVNPQGCTVTAFKQPSTLERSHDFLWRVNNALPERGIIGVHNRSHYEEVLVVKVHPEFVLGQNIPGIRSVKDISPKFWRKRYASIREWEEHQVRQGTVILKFFLNMGRAMQKERFIDRIDDPAKNWKFSMGDVAERAHWDAYMDAYQDAIANTATEDAPWYVIPADDQWESRALVAHVVSERLKEMNLRFPVLDAKTKVGLAQAKKTLMED